MNPNASTRVQNGKGRKLRLAALLPLFALVWGLVSAASEARADLVNTATVSGFANGIPISASDTVSVDLVDEVRGLTVVKTAVVNDGGDGTDDPGDTISYTFTVTNSGNVSLAGVTLADPLVTLSAPVLTDNAPGGNSSDSLFSAAWDLLGPGDTLTYTATYALTPADVGAGQVVNTATANATTVPGVAVSGSDTETSYLNVLSALTLAKTATLNDGGDGVANAGDTISYSFLVTNTGSVTLTNVSVSDPLLNFASLPGRAAAFSMMASVAAGADPMTTASTAAFDPVAAFEGQVRLFAPVATQKLAVFWPGRSIPQLPVALDVNRKIVMLSGDPGMPKTGDRIGIYFDLINAGEGPLTNIRVEQQGAEVFGDALDILPPNSRDSASIIFTRVLTEDDISSGFINASALVRVKARDRAQVFAVVEDIPLATISGMEELATASILPANVPSLAPGASTTFTASLVLTQAHVDAGVVNNSAEASGTDPFNAVITSPDSASTPLPAVPGIAVIKQGTVNPGVDGVANAGDTIDYTFTIRNTGNVTLSNIILNDPAVTPTGGPIATLAPNAVDSTTFTASYTLQQADIDAGHFDNQAQAVGTLPGGTATVDDFSDDASETENDVTVVNLASAPAIALIKQLDTSTYPTAIQDVNSNNMADVGDIVHYSFQVQNTGNVTLSNVNIVDRNPAIAVTPPAAPPTGVALAPGQIDTTTFTAQYTLTQVDVDAGVFNNTADVYGTAPDNTVVTDESDPGVFTQNAPTPLVIPAQPGIALLKQANPVIADTNGSTLVDAGDTINYSFTVINTGNVTLTNLTLTDNNAVEAGGPISALLPGTFDNATFTASHIITTADMTAGEVMNRARITATTPASGTVQDDSDPTDVTENDYTIVALVAQPSISVVKRFVELEDTDNSSTVNAGDTIRYDIDVRNTGNVPLTQVTITEQPGVTLLGGPQIALLDAGDTDTTTFSAEYVLTPADIANGVFSNSAVASGVAPDLSVVNDDSDESVFDDESASNNDDPTVTSLAGAGIALVKQFDSIFDANGDTITNAGDVIRYTLVVTNTGSVPVTVTSLTDNNGTVIETAPGPLVLAPGQSNATHFRAEHLITLADMNNGSVSNQATVNASSSAGPVSDLSDESSVTGNDITVTPLTQAAGIAVIKTVFSISDNNDNGLVDLGDVVNYRFAIYNTGNVTLTNIILTDVNATVACAPNPIANLAPGAVDSTSCTATHVVTLADQDAGQIINRAHVIADIPGGGTIEDESDPADLNGDGDTVTRVAEPVPVFTKTVAKSQIIRGEQVEYTISATGLRAGPYDVADIMPPGFGYVAGTATVNGSGLEPVESGNVLTFAGLTPDPSSRIIIKLKLLAATSLLTGDYVNRANLILTDTGEILATARATVRIKEEHVFDCGEIIGRVFDDLNGNGYADEGEPGLPGVRVSTVNGLLVTTDKRGRFHVACADIPNAMIGSNFLMKLDTRTLPAGYKLSTENPRDVRLTRGKITKLNFGAVRHREIELELKRDAFVGVSTTLKGEWQDDMDRLVTLLQQGRGALSIVYRCGQRAPIVDARLEAVKALVEAKWREGSDDRPLTIKTRVECGK